VDLVVLVSLTITDVLESSFGAETISAIAVPLALLLTTGAIAWYHFLVFREDRATTPEAAVRVLSEVLLVSSDGGDLAAALESALDVPIRRLRQTGLTAHGQSVEDVLDALADGKDGRVLVLDRGEAGYDVVALEA
jgi:hypothetical protein